MGLLILYCALIEKKDKWMLVLYGSVSVVNLGYLLLSVSTTVEFALLANKIAYLGQIFILISMYLIIVKLCGYEVRAGISGILIGVGVLMFALVCTSGYLPWYYKEVSLEYADGAAKLVKQYGPLHVAYLIYVLMYFALMLSTIILSIRKKRVASGKQAGLMLAVVLCNIGMWIIEKFVTWNFEFLSVSYVLSLGMLFFLYWMMQDYVHKTEVASRASADSKKRLVVVDNMPKAEKMAAVMANVKDGKTLTPRQLEMLEGIIDGKSRKEIAAELHISENTVKMHTSLLYDSLGVSSREDIFAMIYQKNIK